MIEQLTRQVCKGCGEQDVISLLDLGDQPMCNRFLEAVDEVEFRHRLILGRCTGCGLVQLLNPAAFEVLQPRFEWIKYNEPGKHSSHLADFIWALPGVDGTATACGISVYDEPLLVELMNRGIGRSISIEPQRHLRLDDNNLGVETIQNALNPNSAREIVKQEGRSDLVIASFILEHAHDPSEFLSALRNLIAPGGYVIVTVPDCQRSFEALDYSVLWEDHVMYFTADTLQGMMKKHGFTSVGFHRFPYRMADCLVGVWRISNLNEEMAETSDFADGNAIMVNRFATEFDRRRQVIQRDLAKRRGKVAVIGGGHMASMFINLLELADIIEFVVDDDPHKQGLFMPGSRLPICEAGALVEENIDLCLLTVSPEIEDRVIKHHREFTDRGGEFFSIYPFSGRALNDG
jgi:hypothetical protein